MACVDEPARPAEASAQADQSAEKPAAQDSESPATGTTSAFRLGRQILRFHAAHADDQAVAERGAATVPQDADLREPFERVREALNETAQSGAGR